jgi:hydrogenase maturation factor
MVLQISGQLFAACRELGISFIGGHTEITFGIERPIIAGTMIGEVARSRLVTPRGAAPTDAVLLTKGLAIEATAILAREFPDRLRPVLGEAGLLEAAAYLHQPGISVLPEARAAVAAGQVTAMHDPTEGGLAAALWELAEACGHNLEVDTHAAPISPVSQKICDAFGLNPLNTISSGALLLTVKQTSTQPVCAALQQIGIPCAVIGTVQEGPRQVWDVSSWDVSSPQRRLLPRPTRDDITKAYE